MNTIFENTMIEEMTKKFHRSQAQVNGLQTSDAEIIRCSGMVGQYLALTTDSVAEEIEMGLYDPYLSGWMAVMANLSDLAAVGARPIGVLISEMIPADFPAGALEQVQHGIHDACCACGTFILGGDTNTGSNLLLTGCACGVVEGDPLSRVGAGASDVLYTSGSMGSGNAFALAKMTTSGMEIPYRPIARIKEGLILHGFASACMDTSDGLIATLDQMMRLNHVGFAIDDCWDEILRSDGAALTRTAKIPAWLLLAGQHGEYELVFTISAEIEAEFLAQAAQCDWGPLRLGKAIPEQELFLPLHGNPVSIDTAYIRNLPYATHGDVRQYIDALMEYDKELRKGELNHANEPAL